MSRAGRQRWLLLALGLAIVLLASVALARPGGGHSYSGGSRSSSRSSGGGGGGDGGILADILIYLIIQNPSVGIPLVLLVLAVLAVRWLWQRGMRAWSTSRDVPVDAAAVGSEEVAVSLPRRELEQLRSVDPEFSLVLFEDFAYMLYGAVQRARGLGAQWLAPYLAPDLVETLVDPSLADVQGIVIGAFRYEEVSGFGEPMLSVELEIESNYVEVSRSGAQHRYYAVDRMLLTRAHSARSRPFARAHKLDCPNCGAPLEALRGNECSYCRQHVGLGRCDWMIVTLDNHVREEQGPLLTSDSPERGTDLPTLTDAAAPARFQELQQRDPSFSWQTFTMRIAHVFGELQAAWAGREPLRIRPYVSDNQFQSLYYWLDLYQAQRCRNVTEQARILRIDLVSVTSDKHYDAITVRLFASSIDYTIADDGKLLSGSRSRTRTYSEYWTWIRGSARRGPSRGDMCCPNCGAGLRVGMAGNCEYCRVKVTAGEFDWVLSRIEQDDAYTG
ncbi:MAG TPA: Tim44-like domain-containing protein [Polyangiaceae bacterium]